MGRTDAFRRVYKFLLDREQLGSTFTVPELGG